MSFSSKLKPPRMGGAEGGDEYWWATLDILAGRQEKKPRKDIMADVDDWLAKLTAKIAKQRKAALDAPKTPEKTAVEEEPKKTQEQRKVDPKKTEPKKVEPLPEYQYLQTSFGDHIEIQLNFSNPRVRSRLEKLMGSNVVRITDRKYMIKLQERIKEDHLENQKKRIQEREAEEVEREKRLVLEGKIPIEAAPKELKNHPVCKINQITKKILEKGKTKPQSRATSSKSGSKKDKNSSEKSEKDEKIKETEESEPAGESNDEDVDEGGAKEDTTAAETAEDLAKNVMLKKEEYEKLKYEAPLVKTLRQVENVGEMYKLADEIVGPLKHQKTSQRRLRQESGGAGGPPS